MDLIPHTGELLLILGVAALIFGLGRLPQISFALASLGKGPAASPPPPPSGEGSAGASPAEAPGERADKTDDAPPTTG